MRTLAILFILSSLSLYAGDRYTLKVVSQGRGKGYAIRPEIYKGGNTEATYHIHTYYRGGTKRIYCKCTKVTYKKGATYKPVTVNTNSRAEYGCVIWKNGKKVYTKVKGSAVSKQIKADASKDCLKN